MFPLLLEVTEFSRKQPSPPRRRARRIEAIRFDSRVSKTSDNIKIT